MNRNVLYRVVEEAKYIVDTGDTIRRTADIFDVSKSTVHKDMRERLKTVDTDLYEKVSNILEYHIDIKHIRGGESTKRKFLAKKVN